MFSIRKAVGHAGQMIPHRTVDTILVDASAGFRRQEVGGLHEPLEHLSEKLLGSIAVFKHVRVPVDTLLQKSFEIHFLFG